MNITKQIFVSGKVQGVFYRDSTQQKAREIGVFGWVCNLPDGRVEARISGDTSKVDELIKWMHKGPISAKVTEIEEKTIDYADFHDFIVTYS